MFLPSERGLSDPLVELDKISDLLANKEQLLVLESKQPGQLAVARFSED